MDLASDIDVLDFTCVAAVEGTWRDPVAAAAAFAEEPYALVLLSDGSPRARWSYLMRAPVRVLTFGPERADDPFAAAAAALGPPRGGAADGPPFQGGVAGLVAYEAGLRREPGVGARRSPDWADLDAGVYPALIAFDHHRRRLVGVGRGADAGAAAARAREALAWLGRPSSETGADGGLAQSLTRLDPPGAYPEAVADVVSRIAAGEIFQANIARAWGGRLATGRSPFELFARLARTSPAPFAAYLRLPGRAVVSNSPERFIAVDASGRAETRPIKGTRPRGANPDADAAFAAELAASPKDRAENLMIVDLMRNDLARACAPGTVEAPDLFRSEVYANVHHLVSTVTGRLSAGASALDLLGVAFPPGSVTGAPKVQAMRVIAGHEPPRGPYCGAMVWAGFDGAMDSSVLIRTVALVEEPGGWRYEFRAGAGIVADSDPAAEDAEAEAKASAIARALGDPA